MWSCSHTHTTSSCDQQFTRKPVSSFSSSPTRMGQRHAKANQGGDQGTQQTQNIVHKSNGAKELIAFMERNYDEVFADVKDFDDFYHAIFQLIEMFCEKRGQLQYKIPTKKELEKAFNTHHRSGGPLKKDEFVKITDEVIKTDSFAFGKAAVDVIVFLFGAPVCMLFVKRIVPGLSSISDDVVIPIATAGSVVCLAKTNRL